MANPTQAQIDKLTTNLTRWDSIVNGSSGTTVALDSHTVNTVSYYLQQLTATNPRGAWATSTAYALKDVVVESSIVYICTVAHTSGTFATDLGNGYWAVQQLDVTSPISFGNDFTVDTNVFHVDSTNNRVGIGNTTPTAVLDVTSGLNTYTARFGKNDTHGLFLHSQATVSHYNWLIASQDQVSTALEFSPSTAVGGTTWDTPVLCLLQSGNTGFNTVAPSRQIHVKSNLGNVVSGYQQILESAQGGYGAGISFQSPLQTSGVLTEMARITSDALDTWDSASAATQDAGLLFFTSLNGSVTEKMRIVADGGLVLGATALTTNTNGNTFTAEAQQEIFSITKTWLKISNSETSAGTYAGLFLGTTNGNGLEISREGNAADIIFDITQSGGDFSFKSDATEIMRLESAGNLGIGTVADASALLDVQSTTKGVRFPNMTTTQRDAISSPAAGLVIYNTTTARLNVFTTSWVAIH